ncbi:MAG: hypothetical protein ABI353_02715 [Isosphaeraceae bacterium]
MVATTVLATLPGPGLNQRLQVALIQGDDGLMIDLHEQHFAEGIGWFDQRSMMLEPWQFRQLQAVLGLKAAHVLDEVDEPRATIPFPGLHVEEPRRSAAGLGS